MGRLLYGSRDDAIALPDELLAYVRLVAGVKLRNNESFMLSWHHQGDDPGDRSSVWMHPSIPVRFVFDQPATTEIDPALLSRLHTAANGASGLVLPGSVSHGAEADGSPDERLQRGSRGPTPVVELPTRPRRSA